MAADATADYINARAAGKDAAILCDTWEIADAINQRLHDHYTRPEAPSVKIARDQHVRAGDLIISRRNDATLTVRPGAGHRRGQQVDQVRNGNRWRVLAVDADQGRIAAERITDAARTVYDGDYRREHLTLGYASTVHSAQGMTVGDTATPGVCWTVLSDRASRAMAYVGISRGRDENHLAIYPATATESDHRDTDTPIHQMQRGTKHAAAQCLRAILAHDDHPVTLHTVAARTDRALLPTAVAALLDRNDQRRAQREQTWRQHCAETRRIQATYQRLVATSRHIAQRERSRSVERDYGLEM